jgi:hypothetical protein
MIPDERNADLDWNSCRCKGQAEGHLLKELSTGDGTCVKLEFRKG